jgi:hypothetical protein
VGRPKPKPRPKPIPPIPVINGLTPVVPCINPKLDNKGLDYKSGLVVMSVNELVD